MGKERNAGKKSSLVAHSGIEQLERRLLLSGAIRGVLPPAMGPGLPAEEILPANVVLPQKWFSNLRGSRYLTKPSGGSPIAIALGYVRSKANEFGVSAADVADLLLTDQYTDADTGTVHLYFRQRSNGVEVSGADVSVSVNRDGRVVYAGGSLVNDLAAKAARASTAASQPPVFAAPLSQFAAKSAVNGIAKMGLSADRAVLAAASRLGLTPEKAIAFKKAPNDHQASQDSLLAAPGISLDDVPAHLQLVFTNDGELHLAWNLVVRTPSGHWYDLSVDRGNGSVLAADDWSEGAHFSSQYNVLASPTESPLDGNRQIVSDPFDPAVSPFGWDDTNGAAGNEYTDTRGNNVFAQEDADANNTGGYRPTAVVDQQTGALTFNYPLDLTQDPSAYRDASIANVFYWVNLLHDVHAQYGFDEAAGNFQMVDYGGAGVGGDPVMADVQDGAGKDDSNFSTPPDGFSPRMQLYLFDKTTPGRDSALDTQIIVHEYGHGVSTRLTGGPSNSNSLSAFQSSSMGEGWGDFWALMFTQKLTDTQNGRYPIGTYTLGQDPQTGQGARSFPYSFDMSVDPVTFKAVKSSSSIYDRGQVWASALWDLNWLLINKNGYSADWQHGYDAADPNRNGGNNLALKLVMDGLKLQPANPSFLAARDAILAADAALTGGANELAIWTAFARRGMGYSAQDGNSSSSQSVIEAFDLPPAFRSPQVIGQSPAGLPPVSSPVSQIDLSFSQAMDPSSFSVADDVVSFLSPGGADLKSQISGFSWVSSTRLRITFNAQSAEGLYQLTVGPNILSAEDHRPMDQDRDGTGGEAAQDSYTASFRIDLLSLAVVSTVPANNTLITAPTTTLDFNFNEPVSAATLQASDLVISRGSVSGVSAVDADTVRFTLAGISGEGDLTFSLGSGVIGDSFGNPNAAYSGSLHVDNGTIPFPGTFSTVQPFGSLVYTASANTVISTPADVDTFTLHLLSGQSLRASLPTAAGMVSKLEIRNSHGDLLSTVAQGSTSPLIYVPSEDTYSLAVSAVSGTGTASLSVTLNQSDEVDPTNSSTPQNIEPLFQPVIPGLSPQRVEIEGLVGSPDLHDAFTFNLSAGESLSAALFSSGLSIYLPMMIKSSNGTLMATSSQNSAGLNSAFSDFIAPVSDTYTLAFDYTDQLRNYSLAITRDAGIEIEPHVSPAQAELIASKALGVSGSRFVVGNLSGTADYYKVAVKAGDVLRFETTTPNDSTVPALNLLDPKITLFGSNQAQVAMDDNSASDGKNARLTYTAPADGFLYVSVSGSTVPGTTPIGNYMLEVAGATGAVSTPTGVLSITNGAHFNTVPATVSFTLSESVMASSVSASDLLIDGVPASSATVSSSNPRLITFTLNSGLAEGNHTLTIAPGAIFDLHNSPAAGVSSSFVLDKTGPHLVSSSIQNNDVLAPFNDVVFRLKFDEALDMTWVAARFKDSNFTNTLFVNATTFHLPERNFTYAYDPATFTLTMTFPTPVEGVYTFNLPGSSVVDLADNGMAAGNYVVQLTIYSPSVALPTSVPVGPPGAQIYQTAAPFNLRSGSDTNQFTLDLKSGEYFSLRVEPGSGLLWPRIIVKDPNGKQIAAGNGIANQSGLSINGIPADVTGTYTIIGSVQTGNDANIGSSTLYVAINGAVTTSSGYLTTPYTAPFARFNLPIATLTGRSITSASSANAKFDMAAGDFADIVVTPGGSKTIAGVQLLSVSGTNLTLLTTSAQLAGDGSYYFKNFRSDVAKTYLVRPVGYTGTSPDLNPYYGIAVVKNAGMEIEPNDTNAQANRFESPLVAGERAYTGYISAGGDQDRYALNVAAGQTLTFRTTTPDWAPAPFTNLLDPKLSLYDASGNLLASDDNSAADGRNASLTFTTTSAGIVYLAVSAATGVPASAGQGAYAVASTASGVFPFTATVTNPPDGSIRGSQISSVTVTFNDDVDVTSVIPGDLQVDAGTATTVTIPSPRQVTFGFPALGQGLHTLHIAAGAIQDTQTTPIDALTSTFSIDSVRPTVLSSTLADGQVVSAGDLSFTVQFSEPLALAVTQNMVGLRGVGRASNYYAESVVPNATNDALTFTYRNLPDDSYTFNLPAGAIVDSAGNSLLNPFVRSFFADAVAPQAIGPTVSDTQAGPLSYRESIAAALSDSNDVDSFSVPLDPGQVITARLSTGGNFIGSFEMTDPNGVSMGTFSATAASGTATANGLMITTGGTYTLTVSSLGGGASGSGVYTATMELNTIHEFGSIGGPSNHSMATAQPLNLLPISGSAGSGPNASAVTRAAVAGSLDNFFVADFEDGLDGFTFDNSGGGLWHLTMSLGTNSGHSATHSLYYGKDEGDNTPGNYDTGAANSGSVLSPLITLPNVSNLSLRFSYFLVTEKSATKDKAKLQISTNNGATFTDLNTYSNVSESASWQNTGSTSLSAYAGQTVILRWSFDSIDGSANNFPGWYIDDVQISGATTANDYYSVPLSAGDKISVNLALAVADSLQVALLDSSGFTLASNSTGSSGLATLNAVTISDDGIYYIRVNGSVLDNYNLNVVRNGVIESEPNNAPYQAQVIPPVKGAARVIGLISPSTTSKPVFSDTFEGTSLPTPTTPPTLGSAWSTYSSRPQGVLRIGSDQGAAGGVYAMLMEGANDGVFTLNEATLTVDLTGVSNSNLDFSQASFGDEIQALPADFAEHFNGDGVSISDDGIHWHKVWSPSGTETPGLWSRVSIDLAAQAAAAGMRLGPNFKIRFQQYDDSSLAGGDGRGYDSVLVSAATPESDYYSLNLTAADAVTIRTYTPGDAADGEPHNRLDPSLKIFGPDGKLVGSDSNSGPDGRNPLVDFSAARSGNYIIEVTGETLGLGYYVLDAGIVKPVPVPGMPDLAPQSDTGIYSEDNRTKLDDSSAAKSLTFTVQGVSTGATVTLFIDGVALPAIVAGSSTVTFTTPGTLKLADGSHTASATQQLSGQAASDFSPTLLFITDTTPGSAPLAPVLQPTSDTALPGDKVTAVRTPAFNISGVGDPYFRAYLNGVATGPAYLSGSVLVLPSLADGSYSLAVASVDAAGNESPRSAPINFQIVSTAPLPPTIAPDLDDASDSGFSTTDNITNINTPTINVPAGLLGFRVFVNGIPTTTAPLSGTSYVLPKLADGRFDITYSMIDGAGDESDVGPKLTITIATVVPAIPSPPDLLASSDLGISSTDNITKDNTPTLAAIGAPYYRLYRNDVLLTSAYFTGNFTSDVVPDGTAVYTVVAVDAAGNVSAASGPLSVVTTTVIPPAPTIAPDLAAFSDSGVSDSDNITSIKFPALILPTGSNEYQIYRDGALTVGYTPGGQVNLSQQNEGTHIYSYTISDIAGNESAFSPSLSIQFSYTGGGSDTSDGIDLLPDSDTGVADNDNKTSDNTPTFSTYIATGLYYHMFCDGALVSGFYENAPTFTSAPLADGVHTFTIESLNAAGIIGFDKNMTIYVDTAAPTSSVNALPAFSPLGPIAVSWSGQDPLNPNSTAGTGINSYDIYVSDNDGPFTLWLGATTATSATYPAVAQHAYAFYSRARDTAGNLEDSPATFDTATNSGPDINPPTVLAATLDAPSDAPPSPLSNPHLTIVFSEDIRSPISASMFHVRNQTLSTDITPAAVTYTPSAHTAVVTFAPNQLSDGNYTLTLLSNEFSDLAGNPLDGDNNGSFGGNFSFSFFRLLGDLNGDRVVDKTDQAIVASAQGKIGLNGAIADINGDGSVGFADLVALAQHYGKSGARRIEGDANGDGSVGFADLVIIAQNYGSVPMADLDRDGTIGPADLAILNANLGHSLPNPAPLPQFAQPPIAVSETLAWGGISRSKSVGTQSLSIVRPPRKPPYSVQRIVSRQIFADSAHKLHANSLFGTIPLRP